MTAVADLITMLINGPENPYNCPTPMWGDPWAQLSLHPKADVDWISRFCTAHYGLSLYSIMGRDMPPKICPFVWGIQAATWYLISWAQPSPQFNWDSTALKCIKYKGQFQFPMMICGWNSKELHCHWADIMPYMKQSIQYRLFHIWHYESAKDSEYRRYWFTDVFQFDHIIKYH